MWSILPSIFLIIIKRRPYIEAAKCFYDSLLEATIGAILSFLAFTFRARRRKRKKEKNDDIVQNVEITMIDDKSEESEESNIINELKESNLIADDILTMLNEEQ